MPFLTANWITAFACMFVFVAMGAHEARDGTRPNHGWLWALASIALSALAITFFNASMGLVLVLQVLLFFAIGAFRVVLEG